ncbi:MAG: ImmA/IrrE family metallo-endopeptidase [Bacteroidia bacterium]|nr:ImmA/IrrE family metallo-endopeptidase [Bacteroidia bacterium]
MFSKDFYEKIEEQVSKLLLLEGVESYPVPVEKIALSLGVDVMPYNLGEEVSGILAINDGKGTIGYNLQHSKGRQRFTVAHELGHYIMHRNTKKELFVDKDYILKFRSNKKYSSTELKQEREANAFAAALLMPKDFILSELAKEQTITENELIEVLAKRFEVSVPAMTYRIADLNSFL